MASHKLQSKFTLAMLQKEYGKYTNNMEDTLEYLMDEFVPTDDKSSDTREHRAIREASDQPINTSDDTNFTQMEVGDIIRSMNSKKAPGPDGISSAVILRTFNKFPLTVSEVYCQCLNRAYFPDEWKTSLIIPVVKPGKANSSQASKYRPISLINTGGKILEKLLISRIMAHLKKHDSLNKNQFGFIPGSSTTEALMAVKNIIDGNLKQNNDTVLISLDVKGAFNAAWWPSILKSLLSLRCPKNLFNLTKQYFSGRTAIMESNKYKLVRKITKGCPQGSCCGPGYWNILYNSLLNTTVTSNTKLVAFADDLLILSKGRNHLEAESTANIDLNKIVRWAQDNKIEFNNNKSKVMYITKKRSNVYNNSIQVYINNRMLEQVDVLKYLGIYIDEKFNFNEHLKITTQKCTKLINILAKHAKITWGLQCQALRSIYQGAIIPILTYGAPMWSTAISKQYNRKKLRSVQRLINIRIVKSFRTLSFDASCIISGFLPLDLKIEASARAYHKIKQEGVSGNGTSSNKSRRLEIKSEMLKISETKWEEEWEKTTNGEITKAYFPTVLSRRAVKLPWSASLTTLLSGHGKIKHYYFRFKISETPLCICGNGEQSVNHIIYTCPIYTNERTSFINEIALKGTSWPEAKDRLINKNFSAFIKYLLSINLELIQ